MTGPSLRTRASLAVGAALSLALALLVPAPATGAVGSVPVPADGSSYFGVVLGNGDTPATYAGRSGLRPASYGHFAGLPLTSTTKQSLSTAADAIRAENGILFLTVEPHDGLATVTTAVAQDLAAVLADINSRGVPVLLRFAHEMNGSWYAWGQQPTAYVAAYRRVADAVHAVAARTSVVWAPNYGGGYPYTGGAYSARPGTADFTALDTDRSGSLSMADDPYAPYYPGDAYVDWVGLTLYHFGHAWPYGENEVPEPGTFVQQLRGAYTGNGRYEDQSALPDFYASFAVTRGKPMAITETSAFFNETPPVAGATDLDIKRSWIDQVYGAATQAEFPLLKLVTWFEVRKFEAEANGTVDWRATADPAVLEVLRAQVARGTYVFAPSTTTPPPAAQVPGAPTSLLGTAGTHPTRVTLSWRPPVSDGGAAVTGYSACIAGSGTCRPLTAGTLTTTFTGLARKTTYTFTVVAANSVGSGAPAQVTVRTR